MKHLLHLLTTEAFAEWFAALDASLLLFQHPIVSQLQPADSLSWDHEAWGVFRDYAKQILKKLDSPRFAARLSRLGPQEAAAIRECIREIRSATEPRLRWALKVTGDPFGRARNIRPENACDEARRLYFTALEATGFKVADVPAHSLSLREFSRRVPAPAFRLLYGVDLERKTALVILGEWLDRSSYSDSVHRAERTWKEFLDGQLRALEPVALW